MGKSDIDFDLKTINNPAYANMLLLHLKGRIVPDEGGRETQVDCNLLLNVSDLLCCRVRYYTTACHR